MIIYHNIIPERNHRLGAHRRGEHGDTRMGRAPRGLSDNDFRVNVRPKRRGNARKGDVFDMQPDGLGDQRLANPRRPGAARPKPWPAACHAARSMRPDQFVITFNDLARKARPPLGVHS